MPLFFSNTQILLLYVQNVHTNIKSTKRHQEMNLSFVLYRISLLLLLLWIRIHKCIMYKYSQSPINWNMDPYWSFGSVIDRAFLDVSFDFMFVCPPTMKADPALSLFELLRFNMPATHPKSKPICQHQWLQRAQRSDAQKVQISFTVSNISF